MWHIKNRTTQQVHICCCDILTQIHNNITELLLYSYTEQYAQQNNSNMLLLLWHITQNNWTRTQCDISKSNSAIPISVQAATSQQLNRSIKSMTQICKVKDSNFTRNKILPESQKQRGGREEADWAREEGGEGEPARWGRATGARWATDWASERETTSRVIRVSRQNDVVCLSSFFRLTELIEFDRVLSRFSAGRLEALSRPKAPRWLAEYRVLAEYSAELTEF